MSLHNTVSVITDGLDSFASTYPDPAIKAMLGSFVSQLRSALTKDAADETAKHRLFDPSSATPQSVMDELNKKAKESLLRTQSIKLAEKRDEAVRQETGAIMVYCHGGPADDTMVAFSGPILSRTNLMGAIYQRKEDGDLHYEKNA